jgi:hypothetical protein
MYNQLEGNLMDCMYIFLYMFFTFPDDFSKELKHVGNNRPRRAHRGSRGIALLILDLGARRGWVVSTKPRPLYPQGRSGRVRKILPPPGFDPQTVQPVASRYTN